MPQIDLGKIVGDPGPQGPRGLQGNPGEKGETGSQGPGVAAGGAANQVLVKHSGTNFDTMWVDAGSLLVFAGVQYALAIVADGDTHPAIADGQFVYVRNHSTLDEGLYKATAAIGTDVALTTSNLTADSAGGLNDLQAQVNTLNDNKANISNLSYGSYTYTSQAAMETGLVNLVTALGVSKTTAIYMYPNFGGSMFGGAPGVATIETGSSVSYFSVLFHNYVGVFYGKYLNGTWTWDSLVLNSNFDNMFTRKYRTYTNITIPSSGYIKVDSYSDMGVNTNLYTISMNVRGWSGSINGVTLGKGTNGTDFYLVGDANTTITSITAEYVFSRY